MSNDLIARLRKPLSEVEPWDILHREVADKLADAIQERNRLRAELDNLIQIDMKERDELDRLRAALEHIISQHDQALPEDKKQLRYEHALNIARAALRGGETVSTPKLSELFYATASSCLSPFTAMSNQYGNQSMAFSSASFDQARLVSSILFAIAAVYKAHEEAAGTHAAESSAALMGDDLSVPRR